MITIYAIPEVRPDALTAAYVEDINGVPEYVQRVLWSKQAPVDEVKVGVPQVKVAGRVT